MMRARLVVFLLVGVSAVFGLILARQLVLSRDLPHEQFRDRTVQLLTYATFVGAAGPGNDLIKEFQKGCKCKVSVTSVSDAGLLLERLKMGRFDVVIGLDQLMLGDARQLAWHNLVPAGIPWAPEVAHLAGVEFFPFDWSPLAFVYKEDGKPIPLKFEDLLSADYRKQFALQDPRASSPGMQFANWVKMLKGAGTEEFLKKFKDNVQSVSPSWAFSYGLFKKGQARFVFSYLTSLAYHWGVEKDRGYKIVQFPEGHPVQVELAAVPASCKECELGADFVRFLLEPESQKTIMEKNFMLPAIQGMEKDSVFAELPKLKTLATGTEKDLSDWDRVFGK